MLLCLAQGHGTSSGRGGRSCKAQRPLHCHQQGRQEPRLSRTNARVLRVYAKEDVKYDFNDELGDLAVRIEELAKSVDEGLKGTSLFLIGMMGSGKSTTGKMLANVLKYCFFDSDSVIEQAVGGASISEIFASNGEASFRDIEQAVLSELSSYRNCVIATGGGVVGRSENWGAMQVGVTVYLEGSPELLSHRILSQDGGASRPLLSSDGSAGPDQTVSKLTSILREREASYRNADCVVSLSGKEPMGASSPEMVFRILSAVNEKIQESNKEREERKQFEIQYHDEKPAVDTMTVREPYDSKVPEGKPSKAHQPES